MNNIIYTEYLSVSNPNKAKVIYSENMDVVVFSGEYWSKVSSQEMSLSPSSVTLEFDDDNNLNIYTSDIKTINMSFNNNYIIISPFDLLSKDEVSTRVNQIKDYIKFNYSIKELKLVAIEEISANKSIDDSTKLILDTIIGESLISLKANEREFNVIEEMTPNNNYIPNEGSDTRKNYNFKVVKSDNIYNVNKGSVLYRPSIDLINDNKELYMNVLKIIDDMLYNQLILPKTYESYELLEDKYVDAYDVLTTLLFSTPAIDESIFRITSKHVEVRSDLKELGRNKVSEESSAKESNIEVTLSLPKIYNSSHDLVKGKLRVTEVGFELTKGSQLRWPNESLIDKYKVVYDRLNSEILRLLKNSKLDENLIAITDISISSPSAAANLLRGRQYNGWTAFEELQNDRKQIEIIHKKSNHQNRKIDETYIEDSLILPKIYNVIQPPITSLVRGALKISKDGFYLTKGSQLVFPNEVLMDRYEEELKELNYQITILFDEGKLDENLVTSEDIPVSSPTFAANLLRGSYSNGWASFDGLKDDRKQVELIHKKNEHQNRELDESIIKDPLTLPKLYSSSHHQTKGQLKVTEEGFELAKGSKLTLPSKDLIKGQKSHYDRFNRIIRTLLKSEQVDEGLIVLSDISVNSPTEAHNLLRGRSGNGWTNFNGLQDDRKQVEAIHSKERR